LEEERISEIEKSRTSAASRTTYSYTSGGSDNVVDGVAMIEESETDGLLGSSQWKNRLCSRTNNKDAKRWFSGSEPKPRL